MKADTIDLKWLNQVLARVVPDDSIKDFGIEDIGAGTGFGGTVLRIKLISDQPDQCPPSIIVKLPVTDTNTFESLQAQGVLMREALFYRDLAPTTNLDIPEIYFVDVSPDDFAIVMEDLGDIKNEAILSMDIDGLELALGSIAKLHAAYWNHPLTLEPWLAPMVDSDDQSRADNMIRLEKAIEIMEESNLDLSYTLKCAYRLRKILPASPASIPLPRPITLVHGDYHANNLHIADNKVTIFDWQLIGCGTPLMDVANLLVTSCDPNEPDLTHGGLLRHYHQALLAEGVTGYSFRKLKRGYSDALFFTFLKFIMILGTISYDVEGGEEMKNEILPKLNACGIAAKAQWYCRLMPIAFFIMKLVDRINGNKSGKANESR